MSQPPPADTALRFVDPSLESAFRGYQAERFARSCGRNMVAALISVVIGHAAIGVFAPEHFLLGTLVAGVFVYPWQVATIVLAPRAQTQAQSLRLQWLLVGSDLGVLALIISVLQLRMGSTLMGLSTLVILMLDAAVVNRRRLSHIAAVVGAIALAYQVTLLVQSARAGLSSQELWIGSVITWLAALQCLMLAVDAERTLRRAFLQDRTIAEQHAQIQDEKARAERLLLNVLPGAIASRLRDNPATIADHVPEASVLFADLAGFTVMSAGMPPAEVVEMLNEVFSHFDELVERHKLEKIKTIGDCYMVAAGVPHARPDHAVALVRLALEMRDSVVERTFAGRKLAFRFGVNSGPVVAGVIGRRKFIYDLWGDTVNVASRMESHGQANTVQVTEDTEQAIRDHFECALRGTVAVKGKGDMQVWQVVGPRAR